MYSYDFYEWVAFFIAYCFIGWAGESLYVSLEHKKWVNRGFLHGPFLPIYGFGAIIILLSTIPVRNSIPLVFLFGMLGATLLEYLTGYVMEQIFHVKYWDYTYEPFNLNGYICLGCSITWGLCSILLTAFIHKPTERLVIAIPERILIVLDVVFLVYFIWDIIMSAEAAFGLKKIIMESEQIQHLQKRLDVFIAFAEDDREEFEKNLAESREEIDKRLAEAKERFSKNRAKRIAKARSIVRRNPGATIRKHSLQFKSLEEFFNNLSH